MDNALTKYIKTCTKRVVCCYVFMHWIMFITLSQRIKRMELEFQLEFAALVFQSHSELMLNMIHLRMENSLQQRSLEFKIYTNWGCIWHFKSWQQLVVSSEQYSFLQKYLGMIIFFLDCVTLLFLGSLCCTRVKILIITSRVLNRRASSLYTLPSQSECSRKGQKWPQDPCWGQNWPQESFYVIIFRNP